MTIDFYEILLRLVFAVLIGCVIGLERNLHGKPTGIKTLGLVALGSALVTIASMDFALSRDEYDILAVSRAIQGVITGIGFLGAGVIIHDRMNERVYGLTTAASIWMTAALGIVCGMGMWKIAGAAVIVVLLLFVIGRPVERILHEHWSKKPAEEKETIASLEE